MNVKREGCEADHPPPLPRLSISGATPLFSFYEFVACTGMTLPFFDKFTYRNAGGRRVIVISTCA
jgi:hypothetical protein